MNEQSASFGVGLSSLAYKIDHLRAQLPDALPIERESIEQRIEKFERELAEIVAPTKPDPSAVVQMEVRYIETGARLRTIDPAAVKSLAESMLKFGLLYPIVVYSPPEHDQRIVLVAGLHRLQAARLLGWEFIDAVFIKVDDIDRRLIEISENLHRAELTVQQRSVHIAAWMELRQVAPTPHSGKPGGIRAAQRELGLEHTEARRAVKIASIGPDAKEAAKRAGLDDVQSALLEVAAAPAAEQVDAVQAIVERRRDRKPSGTKAKDPPG